MRLALYLAQTVNSYVNYRMDVYFSVARLVEKGF